MTSLTQPLVVAPKGSKVATSNRRYESALVIFVVVLFAAVLATTLASVLFPPLSPHLSAGSSSTAANRTMYVVFSNHLDLGFYNPSPLNTSDPFSYFSMLSTVQNAIDQWLPNAVRFSSDMRALNSSLNPFNDTYVWMTHSWIVELFLHCPANGVLRCPSAAQVEDAKNAIARGSITWHAFPFNSQHDSYSADLFEYGVQLSADLATEFHRVGGAPNTVSQRDVPGVTRAVIPLMRQKGLKAYSIGANLGSAPAGVPKAFIWRDNATQSEIFTFYHRDGYGGITPADMHIIPGWGSGLCTNWASDNQGPQSAESYLRDLATIRAEYPGWTVKVSTFDEFVNDLEVAYRAGVAQLPVVTEEIGDSRDHSTHRHSPAAVPSHLQPSLASHY